MRQSVRLSFCPFARSRCRQCAIAATPAPSATLAAATFPSRWIAKKVHPFYKMGAAIHRAGKVLYSVSPSPFCPSFACLPKVRAAPSSVRRSLDGAKPQGRTPRAGFQPGTNLSLPKERKSVFLQWINPFGLSLLRFLPLFGAAFFSKHKKRPLYFYICFWNPMGK